MCLKEPSPRRRRKDTDTSTGTIQQMLGNDQSSQTMMKSKSFRPFGRDLERKVRFHIFCILICHLPNLGDSDGVLKGDSMSANGSETAGPSSKDERPIIKDDRRRNGPRNQERKGASDRSIIRIDHRLKGGYDRHDRRGRQRSPKRSKDDSTRRERHDRKADQNEENWRKYELCKYYIAGTCRKVYFCPLIVE